MKLQLECQELEKEIRKMTELLEANKNIVRGRSKGASSKKPKKNSQNKKSKNPKA